MMDITVGFIGTGNMGTAMIKSIARSGKVPTEKIVLFDVDKAKLSALCKETGAKQADGNEEVIRKSDVIILAVKPGMVKAVLEPYKSLFNETKTLISIAVGIPIKVYQDILGDTAKIIRTMPNINALVGEAMTLVSAADTVNEKEIETVFTLFESFGKVEKLDEKLMSEVTALTGSSPAYVFMFIEAMADAAVLSGIPRGLAYKLASQAVLGSAKMVLETGKHPGQLKDEVCSPAGTTIEAVRSLEKDGFRSAVIEAMNECTKRAKEIGNSSNSK